MEAEYNKNINHKVKCIHKILSKLDLKVRNITKNKKLYNNKGLSCSGRCKSTKFIHIK